jgi:hypothetical protein
LLLLSLHWVSRSFRFAGLLLFDVERNLIAVDVQGGDSVKAFPNTWTRIQNQYVVIVKVKPGRFGFTSRSEWRLVCKSIPMAPCTLLVRLSDSSFLNSNCSYPSLVANRCQSRLSRTPSWITSLLNAAGLRSGTPSFYPVFDVARGEIITILSSGFDDRNRVLFDGIPAPIIYAPSDQINAVVPFELTGPATSITV